MARLETVKPYDHVRGAEFWPAYLRGLAYLAAKNGLDAGTQFEMILDRRGESPDAPLYALAQLGAARAAVLTGDHDKARRAYDAVFALWQDADPEVRPLNDARAEYARLR